MSWKSILKSNCSNHEKMGSCSGCASCEKQQFEKFPDLSGDGKVTRKDILMGRGVLGKDGEKKAIKSDKEIEDEIIAMFKKEGGALGMKNLKSIAPQKELNRVLDSMKRRRLVEVHPHGDLILTTNKSQRLRA